MTTTDTQNPVRRFREAHGWTRRQFAALTGLTYQQTYMVEAGYSPPPRRMVTVLDALGFDGLALKAAYHDWMAARSAQLAAEIRAERTGRTAQAARAGA